MSTLATSTAARAAAAPARTATATHGSSATMITSAAISLHSGHIGDYIAWWTTGAGLLGGACLLALA